MIERSYTKESINKKGTYILVEWSYANKQNKSMKTPIFGRMVMRKRKNKRKMTKNGLVQINEINL